MSAGKISIVLYDLGGGGAERMHIYLANDWAARGFEVEVVLLRKRGPLLPLLAPEVTVTGLEVDRIRSAILPLSAHFRKSRPDVILAAMWPLTSAAILAWLLSGRRARIYVSDHTTLRIACVEELGESLRYVYTSIRLSYWVTNGVIAVSQGVKDELCRWAGVREDLVRVIHNPTATGVSPHRESQSVRESLWGRGFRHHILSVGTLKAQKDHETLIKAFALLPARTEAKLIILGEGRLRSELASLVDKLGLHERVELRGFVQDPYPWFRSADLFVLSSRWEGFGNVLVEALECGVPIVSTDCPSGPSEILGGGRYGKLVPVRAPDALSAAIGESLGETPDRGALMRRAQDFSVSRISGQYLGYMFP